MDLARARGRLRARRAHRAGAENSISRLRAGAGGGI